MGQATESQINMFRGIIALAWADHELTDEEKGQLALFINKHLHLSDAQRAQLLDEVEHPVVLKDVWPAITDSHDRAHLLNVAPVIFRNDGVYCESEKELYELYEQKHLDSIGAAGIEQEIRQLAMVLSSERQARNQQQQGATSPMRRVLQYIGAILP